MKQTLLRFSSLSLAWVIYFCVLSIVGYAMIRLIKKLLSRKNCTLSLKEYGFLVNLIFNAVSGFVLFGILSLPFYLFEWSAKVYTILCIIVVVFAIFYCAKNIFEQRKTIEAFLRKFLKSGFQTRITLPLVLSIISITIILIFLAVDLFFCVARMNYLSGDASVHISRINDIVSNGFTIRDSFFANTIESRYAFNFIYAVCAPFCVIAKAFGFVTYECIAASAPFFRLIQFSATISLICYTFKTLLNKKSVIQSLVWPIIALGTIFWVVLDPYTWWHYYPLVMALSWYAVLFIGLFEMTDRKTVLNGKIAVLIASLAITGTHPTYAMIAIILYAIIILGWVIQDLCKKKLKKEKLRFLIIPFLILLIPCIFVFAQPNLMTKNAIDVDSAAANIQFFNIRLFSPELGITIEKPIRSLVHILGLVSLIFLSFKKSFKLGWAFTAILFFCIITTFNPLFVWLMKKIGIPYWVMGRFSGTNIFLSHGIVLSFGLACLLYCIFKIFRQKALFKYLAGIIVIVLAALLMIRPIYNTYKKSFGFEGLYNRLSLSSYDAIVKEVNPYIKNRSLILATGAISYAIPTVKPVTTIYTEDLHMPPNVDGNNRAKCQKALFRQIKNPKILRGAGIEYIILGTSIDSEKLLSEQDISQQPKDFLTIKESSQYRIIKILKGEISDPPKSCSRYQELEQRGVSVIHRSKR